MRLRALALCLLVSATAVVAAQDPSKGFAPKVGMPGKDVVWVPTPPELVSKMLDLAALTPDDFVIDLGSGDGRNIIAAAKRGVRGLGVEFNPELVALSRRLADEAGVGGTATFVQGDMYEADLSNATVLALYLLPANLNRLAPKFLTLKPGTRIVANTFGPEEWDPDYREAVQGLSCSDWCEALLWIVPARVAGTWRLDDGATLTLEQSFQMLLGTLTAGGQAQPLSGARMRGESIRFQAGGAIYTGQVTGETMRGTVRSGRGDARWQASRAAR